MTSETKIISDSAPMLFYNLMELKTYGELKSYLKKAKLKWEFIKQSDTSNTIKINYKGNTLFHDFDIVN